MEVQIVFVKIAKCIFGWLARRLAWCVGVSAALQSPDRQTKIQQRQWGHLGHRTTTSKADHCIVWNVSESIPLGVSPHLDPPQIGKKAD